MFLTFQLWILSRGQDSQNRGNEQAGRFDDCATTWKLRKGIDAIPIGPMGLVYLSTFTIKINQMQVNIPYMEARLWDIGFILLRTARLLCHNEMPRSPESA